MNNESRRKVLSRCAGIETDAKVGTREIIVPVKTTEGIYKEVRTDDLIPGKFKDYSLENLLELGVNMGEMRLQSDNSAMLKETVEKFAKEYLDNLNTNKDE